MCLFGDAGARVRDVEAVPVARPTREFGVPRVGIIGLSSVLNMHTYGSGLPHREQVKNAIFVGKTSLVVFERLVESFPNAVEVVTDAVGHLFEFLVAHRSLPFLMSCHCSNLLMYCWMFSRKSSSA